MQRAVLPQDAAGRQVVFLQGRMAADPETAMTEDAFLGGRLRLRQPAAGHRLGTDALLLAAATPARGRVVDVGAGAGLVGLALALRGAAQVVLVERNPVFAACARANAERADAGAQSGGAVAIAEVDLFRRRDVLASGQLADQSFDAVATNPPYDQSIRARRTPHALKAAAHAMEGGTLADWLAACMRLLKDRGTLTLIHRADRLADVLAALPRRAGGIAIRPVQPAAGEAATRILVRTTAGSRAPLRLLPSFVLHGAEGAFTPEAQAVHRGELAIVM
jgi:tRNA1(Val) A37 N6-methylase TrmN6